MENVRLFFERTYDWIVDKSKKVLENDKLQYEKYHSVIGFDFDETRRYLDNITNKLFSINKEDRLIYLNLILSEIDRQMSVPMYEEKEIEELTVYERKNNLGFVIQSPFFEEGSKPVKTKRIYYLYENEGQYIDIGGIIADLEYFIAMVFSVFQEFGFNIKEIIDARTDLDYDYENILCHADVIKKSCIRNGKFIRGFRIIPPKATLGQQWIIIRNLMECATGWKLTNDSNQLMYSKKDIAKFISFLCGGSEDRIRKHLEDELIAKDINEIIPYLENIGLHEISNRIKKDAK